MCPVVYLSARGGRINPSIGHSQRFARTERCLEPNAGGLERRRVDDRLQTERRELPRASSRAVVATVLRFTADVRAIVPAWILVKSRLPHRYEVTQLWPARPGVVLVDEIPARGNRSSQAGEAAAQHDVTNPFRPATHSSAPSSPPPCAATTPSRLPR